MVRLKLAVLLLCSLAACVIVTSGIRSALAGGASSSAFIASATQIADGVVPQVKFVVGAVPDGNWIRIASGSTAVNSNVDTIVIADQPFEVGQIPVFYVSMMLIAATNNLHIVNLPTNVVPAATEARYDVVRKAGTTRLWDFHIRHNDGTVRAFDWVAYKLVP